MKKLKIGLLIILAAFLITGCQKGDKGDTGDTGPAGPSGPKGSANVSSTNYTVATGTWGGVNTGFVFKDITINEITQSILDNGVVMVYEGGPSQWNALPHSNQNDEWRFLISTQRLRVILLHANGTNVADPGSKTFKVVIISGDAMTLHPNLNLNNYDEVKYALQLED